MRVLKFTLHDRGIGDLLLPMHATILHVGDQCGALQMWVKGHDGPMRQTRRFIVAYTGFDEIPSNAVHVGTVLSLNASMVRHVFEVPAP